jgi:probable rRNA maturation factor
MKKPNKSKNVLPDRHTKHPDGVQPIIKPIIQPVLQLSVQFVVPAQDLTRQRIRSWVKRAVDQTWLAYAPDAQGLHANLRFVDQTEGQALNTQFRKKPKATNVLTFEYGIQNDGMMSADIIICVPVLMQEAIDQQKMFRQHAAHLIVHGTLHALGFDHLEEDQAQEMEALETEILSQMNIPAPY